MKNGLVGLKHYYEESLAKQGPIQVAPPSLRTLVHTASAEDDQILTIYDANKAA
jgi:hypothetical protein